MDKERLIFKAKTKKKLVTWYDLINEDHIDTSKLLNNK